MSNAKRAKIRTQITEKTKFSGFWVYLTKRGRFREKGLKNI